MNIETLIVKYFNSNDKNEKLELKKELLKMQIELNLPTNFEISVLAHYDTFIFSGKKEFLTVMLSFLK